MAPEQKIHIVVIGAGVIGLTTALLLSRDQRYSVTVLAKHMPGDYDIDYASPWAGANFFPFSKPNTLARQFERDTWPHLARLASTTPEVGIHFQRTVLYSRAKDTGTPAGEWTKVLMDKDPWFKNLVPDFRVLTKEELKPGTDSGTTFTSVCINPPIYLAHLATSCVKNGVLLRRATLSHILSALSVQPRPAILVNCTGLGSLFLGGVADTTLYPARGQTVLVRNSPGVMTATSGTDDGGDEAPYIMQRAAGGGCILGGCLQAHDWNAEVDMALAERIMRRAVALCPQLVEGAGPSLGGGGEKGKGGDPIEKLSVIRHGVGRRPMREGGPRVERQLLDGVQVVHQYGHGGYGYQTSWGSAEEAVRLVGEIAEELSGARARL